MTYKHTILAWKLCPGFVLLIDVCPCIGLSIDCVGNCDIDFFVFRQFFHIVSLKFPKYERVLNFAKKCQIEWKQKHKITKLNEIWWEL